MHELYSSQVTQLAQLESKLGSPARDEFEVGALNFKASWSALLRSLHAKYRCILLAELFPVLDLRLGKELWALVYQNIRKKGLLAIAGIHSTKDIHGDKLLLDMDFSCVG